MLLAGALGLAEPVRDLFVAAARGRVPAAEVLAAARGQASPASDRLVPGGGPVWPGCPYLGLVPFGERDAPVFYGRGELAGQLVRRLTGRLDGPGILLVAGESGVGQVLAAAGGGDAAAGGGRAGAGVAAVAAAGDPARGQSVAGTGDAAGRTGGHRSGFGVPVAVGGAG